MSDEPACTAYATTVRPEWVDYNGHMTDSAYAVVCTEANEVFLDALGLSAAYRERTGAAMYTVEAHLKYLKEARGGEPLRARSVVESHDAKRLWIATELLDGAGDPILAARHLYLHVGPEGVLPFPPDRVAALQAADAARPAPAPAPAAASGAASGNGAGDAGVG